MIVNRNILRQHIKNEYIINRIMNRGMNNKDIKHFCKMGRDKRNWLISAVHFDINNWIEATEANVKTMRVDMARKVGVTLDIVKRVRGEMG